MQSWQPVASSMHVGEQPSPGRTFPSSHSSGVQTPPSPHVLSAHDGASSSHPAAHASPMSNTVRVPTRRQFAMPHSTKCRRRSAPVPPKDVGEVTLIHEAAGERDLDQRQVGLEEERCCAGDARPT